MCKVHTDYNPITTGFHRTLRNAVLCDFTEPFPAEGGEDMGWPCPEDCEFHEARSNLDEIEDQQFLQWLGVPEESMISRTAYSAGQAACTCE